MTKAENATKSAPLMSADPVIAGELQRRKDAETLRAAELSEQDALRSQVHTYPDGSQRVGVPPFPEKSPEEEKADEKRGGPRPMTIPNGMKTSGEPAPSTGVGVTVEELKAQAEAQLNSDVISGKDPHTVNPTTASDKPVLAGTDGSPVADGGAFVDNAGQPDLEAIAAAIEPTGENVDATDEEKAAAVTQVMRENKGPILDDKAETKAKGTTAKK